MATGTGVFTETSEEMVRRVTRELGRKRHSTPTPAQQGEARRPDLARRTSWAIRQAQLRAEEDSVRA
ncbi:MAG: hypothetical protein KY395_07370, partial [Actinobacteria bacterium]|nr:hypothetical protein [Actinomycetota bacterium]